MSSCKNILSSNKAGKLGPAIFHRAGLKYIEGWFAYAKENTEFSEPPKMVHGGGREHRAEKPRAWTVLPALAFHVSHNRHGLFMAAAISANCRKEHVTCHRCSSASSRERWGLDMEYPGGDRKLTQTGCAVRRVSFISGRLLKRETTGFCAETMQLAMLWLP